MLKTFSVCLDSRHVLYQLWCILQYSIAYSIDLFLAICITMLLMVSKCHSVMFIHPRRHCMLSQVKICSDCIFTVDYGTLVRSPCSGSSCHGKLDLRDAGIRNLDPDVFKNMSQINEMWVQLYGWLWQEFFMYVYVYVYVYVCMYKYIYIYIYMFVCMYVYTYIYAYHMYTGHSISLTQWCY